MPLDALLGVPYPSPRAMNATSLPSSAPDSSTELLVSGMTCGNCARHVTEAIQTVPGVRSVAVSLDSRTASVHWAAGADRNVPALIQAVEKEGYGAKVADAHTHSHDHGARKLAGWQITLWIGVIGTVPLMIGEWFFSGFDGAPWWRWVSFALATFVQVFAGAQFYRGAWNQLKVRNSNMDTLVALGSTTAYAYSVWAFFSGHGGHLYFMEAASIITLISIGHWMESRVSLRASDALRKLMNLAPQMARRRNADGAETEVPVAELKIGDEVVLRPGDRVPTDGTVLEGNSAVDEAMLTGESAAVDKHEGSPLFAGTVNFNGKLVMRVTAMGDQTALAHIIAAVQRAQISRANIQRLGDRVSSVFVPIVVAIAIASGLWWGLNPESAKHVHYTIAQFLWHAHSIADAEHVALGFVIAAAVLIIACPCAMGLATPAAIMAGSNAAAKRGILIRDGVALEKAGKITAVIFDKTGTLTTGRPEVSTFATVYSSKIEARKFADPSNAGSGSVTSLLATSRLAATLAQNSSHPVSRAIAKLTPGKIELKDIEEVRGSGVQALAKTESGEWKLLQIGSLRWLELSNVDLTAAKKFFDENSAQGATIVGMAADGALIGLFAIKDAVKPGSPKVLSQLREQGLNLYMITGDNEITAAGVAKQVGMVLENVFSGVRPGEKAELVKKLQARGERVAFVGDGINDAPALEQADLGVAVSRATDVAREAADIILLNSEIESVPEALGLARATLRTIKQNLFWAFFYNAIGVPLAALGFMSPILCAAAMGVSDLVVIGNALRLRNWKSR